MSGTSHGDGGALSIKVDELQELEKSLKISGTSDGNGGEFSIQVTELAKSLEESMASVNETHPTQANTEPGKIPKVSTLLRRVKPDAYKPKILSLGPYHKGCSINTKKNTSMIKGPQVQGMEHYKLLYLNKFLNRNTERGTEIPLIDYLYKFRDWENSARNAYAEDCEMESNDFVKMLLLDCCFVLEIMWSWKEGSYYVKPYDMHTRNPFMGTKYSFQAIIRDMLLLENQLPFFLIRYLFNSVYAKIKIDGENVCLEYLIIEFFEMVVPYNTTITIAYQSDNNNPPSDFLHILDLVHSFIAPEVHPFIGPENFREDDHGNTMHDVKNGCIELVAATCWLLGMHEIAIGFVRFLEKANRKPEVYKISCAAELKNAGIHFVRKDEEQRHRWSSSWRRWNHIELQMCNFLDITFEKGKMKMPKLKVDHHTETILRNLIAFEQCYNYVPSYVTAYAMLMDSIIDTEADVELLQKSRVLVNGLGDSKEVAMLFNNLCKVVGEPDKYYFNLCGDVERHCNIVSNRWCATLKNDYLSTPWTFISVIAACLLLVLTITQTVMSILSYVHPK